MDGAAIVRRFSLWRVYTDDTQGIRQVGGSQAVAYNSASFGRRPSRRGVICACGSTEEARRSHGFESTRSARGIDALVGQQAGGHDRRFRVDGDGPALGQGRSVGSRPGFAPARRLRRPCPASEQRRFFELLATRFGPNLATVRDAVADFLQAPDAESAARLHVVAEPRRQELVRRMNLAPGGTSQLVRMREDLLTTMKDDPSLALGRCRLPPSVRLVVQPRLPRAATDRLVDAGAHPRKDHPLRSRPRDHQLGRPAAAPRAARPALLRLLPPGIERRAVDLRRGRAHARGAFVDRAAPRQLAQRR